MKLATFEATCRNDACLHTFDAPLLSDFSYGEFIYSSIDGQLIRHYSSFDCEVWSFIDKMVSERFSTKSRLKAGVIIQKIIGFVSDRQDPAIPFTQDIYCPQCRSKVTSIDDNNRTGVEDYERLTFNSFMSLTQFEKGKLVDGYINRLA